MVFQFGARCRFVFGRATAPGLFFAGDADQSIDQARQALFVALQRGDLATLRLEPVGNCCQLRLPLLFALQQLRAALLLLAFDRRELSLSLTHRLGQLPFLLGGDTQALDQVGFGARKQGQEIPVARGLVVIVPG